MRAQRNKRMKEWKNKDMKEWKNEKITEWQNEGMKEEYGTINPLTPVSDQERISH